MPQIPPANDFPPGVAQPAQRALASIGITRLDEVATISETKLKNLHGVGPKAIRILREALAERGLSFAAEE